jgi:adenylate cyclase
MVVFTVISLLLTFLISDDFHSPLTKLGDAANEISKGNFEINLPLLKSDEIGKLTERFNEMSLSLKEKEYIKDTFGKAVDPRVRDYMLGQNLKPGGELKFATVLFSDIRSFTTISENLNPDQVVDFLNIYFEKMSQCITEKGGIVNKYIGDAVMAIFGAPLDLENHFDLAFEAALNMIHARDALAKTFEMQGLPALRSGIGIHTGNLLSGNIGSKDRLEYTVIGDTVNLSSRIESLCKKTGHDFLISGETFDRLSEKNKAFCKYEGKVRVKGKTNTAKIYSVNHE